MMNVVRPPHRFSHHFSTVTRLKFVPVSQPVNEQDISRLQTLLNAARQLLVITGAGVSTESGIPDYRSAGIGLYARTSRRPMQYQEFLRSAAARQRYWARNFVGWPRFSSFEPNITHRLLAEWEKCGRLMHLVTQNVDELHRKAGSRRVTELHGSTHRVTCLSCNAKVPRTELQRRFIADNPDWHLNVLQDQLAPDGDVLLPDELVRTFKVPACSVCGGILMPDVIFFGDNVASSVVDSIYELVEKADTVFVVGSSLFVYSGYRFVHRAHVLNKQVAIVNIGQTRADDLAHIKVDGLCSDVLAKLQI